MSFHVGQMALYISVADKLQIVAKKIFQPIETIHFTADTAKLKKNNEELKFGGNCVSIS